MNFLKKMMAYTNCLDRILVISFLNQLDKHNKDYTPLGNFFRK